MRLPIAPSAVAHITRPVAIEMTTDPLFARRVIRLVWISFVALGLIRSLGARLPFTHPAVGLGLTGGWLLMPAVLGLSLRWPAIRYALVLPSSLESLALLAVCLRDLPIEPEARAGWLLITAGVFFGDTLGAWFWLRMLPVPARLMNPFSSWRWFLVGIHAVLVIAGLILIGGNRR